MSKAAYSCCCANISILRDLPTLPPDCVWARATSLIGGRGPWCPCVVTGVGPTDEVGIPKARDRIDFLGVEMFFIPPSFDAVANAQVVAGE